ncbi:hypothetical protein ET475_10425 [Microbacterium protaetiae]|uniref:Uncharacterized protein n=1 Tax=Microbacterium protaetiae TaxID=2509458 RepID=A0A4P6EDL2_9MICO|nr:hypothetical protein [Microbacterium protaetiae]QAY60360.1 hypothetical protein ET475_10425 [Microbacterium protaetiae]
MGVPIGGGIGIVTTQDNTGGTLSPAGYFGDILDTALQKAWSTYHPKLEEQLTQLLRTPDLFAKGFSLYDTHVSISSDLAYTIDRTDTDDVVISVTTGTNRIETHSTQPTAAGKWADPAVVITFALSVSYVLDIPPLTAPVSTTGFSHARILAPDVEPDNLIADFAFLLNDIFEWFSGTDAIAEVEKLVAAMDFASILNDALAPLNAKLTELADQGYWFLDVLVDQLDGHSGSLHAQSFTGFSGAPADQLGIVLKVWGFDRSGVIEGEVHWPAALGAPGLPISAQLVDLSRATSMVLNSAHVAAPPAATAPAAVTLTADMTPAQQAAVPRLTAGVRSPADEGAVGKAMAALSTDERLHAVAELRRGAASRFFSTLGTAVATRLIDEIAHGRSDFVVEVTTPVSPGPGMFAVDRVVGRMSGLWAADDETTMRRRYRVVDVATDVPLTVRARLADGQEWHGSVAQVAAEPDGWQGSVTVHRMPEKSKKRLIDELPNLRLNASAQRAVAGALRGQESALNPQPLPPKSVQLSRLLQFAKPDAAASPAAKVTVSAPHVDTRRLDAVRDQISHLVRKRQNPSGDGVVENIDFVLAEYHPPVIH